MYRDAEQQLKSSLKHQDMVDTYLYLCKVYTRLDQPLTAIDFYKQGLEKFQGETTLLAGIARIYEVCLCKKIYMLYIFYGSFLCCKILINTHSCHICEEYKTWLNARMSTHGLKQFRGNHIQMSCSWLQFLADLSIADYNVIRYIIHYVVPDKIPKWFPWCRKSILNNKTCS